MSSLLLKAVKVFASRLGYEVDMVFKVLAKSLNGCL
jgi:hypothetical protein